jgi:K+-transporting ATPase c subunit
VAAQIPEDPGVALHLDRPRRDVELATARHLALEQVLDLIEENTDERALGFLGELGVNVLELNLALDRLGET